jgi:hypothetical protein
MPAKSSHSTIKSQSGAPDQMVVTSKAAARTAVVARSGVLAEASARNRTSQPKSQAITVMRHFS